MTQDTVNRPTKPDGWNAAIDASTQAEAERRHPPRRFSEMLPVRLTESELAERGRRAAIARQRIAEYEAQKDIATKHWKTKIDGAEMERDELLDTIASGTEDRAIEVIETFEWRTGTVTVTRTDTGEKIRERAMTLAERSPTLPGVDTKQTALAPPEPADSTPATHNGDEGDFYSDLPVDEDLDELEDDAGPDDLDALAQELEEVGSMTEPLENRLDAELAPSVVMPKPKRTRKKKGA